MDEREEEKQQRQRLEQQPESIRDLFLIASRLPLASMLPLPQIGQILLSGLDSNAWLAALSEESASTSNAEQDVDHISSIIRNFDISHIKFSQSIGPSPLVLPPSQLSACKEFMLFQKGQQGITGINSISCDPQQPWPPEEPLNNSTADQWECSSAIHDPIPQRKRRLIKGSSPKPTKSSKRTKELARKGKNLKLQAKDPNQAISKSPSQGLNQEQFSNLQALKLSELSDVQIQKLACWLAGKQGRLATETTENISDEIDQVEGLRRERLAAVVSVVILSCTSDDQCRARLASKLELLPAILRKILPSGQESEWILCSTCKALAAFISSTDVDEARILAIANAIIESLQSSIPCQAIALEAIHTLVAIWQRFPTLQDHLIEQSCHTSTLIDKETKLQLNSSKVSWLSYLFHCLVTVQLQRLDALGASWMKSCQNGYGIFDTLINRIALDSESNLTNKIELLLQICTDVANLATHPQFPLALIILRFFAWHSIRLCHPKEATKLDLRIRLIELGSIAMRLLRRLEVNAGDQNTQKVEAPQKIIHMICLINQC